MSGALWFFFWPPTWPAPGASASATASAVAVFSLPGRGGDHYIPLSEEFWMARADHLRRNSLPQPGPYLQMQWLDMLRAKIAAAESASAELRLTFEMDNDDMPPLF